MKTIVYSLLLIILSTGCAVSNNVREIKKNVGIESAQLDLFEKKVDSLDFERARKVAAGKLDATTDAITSIYIQRLKDSVNARLSYFRAIISYKKKGVEKKKMLEYPDAVKVSYT